MPDNDINAILVGRNFVKKSSAEERVKIDESLNEQIMPPGHSYINSRYLTPNHLVGH
jgi:ribosomal protein L31E